MSLVFSQDIPTLENMHDIIPLYKFTVYETYNIINYNKPFRRKPV